MASTAACAHLPGSGLPGPTPTPSSASPSPQASQSPGPCASPAFGTTTVFIVMSFAISPNTAPTYGNIGGYVAANADGTFADVAHLINVSHTDVIQFVNADNTGPSTILHSAVSFTSAPPFPVVPFTFPAGTQSPIGSIISIGQWSTGRISPTCYSQPFTLVPGTFYFGDYDYYNLSTFRDVIIVN